MQLVAGTDLQLRSSNIMYNYTEFAIQDFKVWLRNQMWTQGWSHWTENEEHWDDSSTRKATGFQNMLQDANPLPSNHSSTVFLSWNSVHCSTGKKLNQKHWRTFNSWINNKCGNKGRHVIALIPLSTCMCYP
jgi:hypothetical protein